MTEDFLRLKGKIQHYAWGGYHYIPQLLNIPKGDQPYAEYWMGAHPKASAEAIAGSKVLSLNKLIHQDPSTYIGTTVFNKFGELPYLFKVLDVNEMLSIQVHPSRAEAIKGFEAEEAAGVPLDAPHRNYKDKNHKPEVMVALSSFWLLHGFKPQHELAATLESVPELRPLISLFENEGYYGLYKHVMTITQQQVDAMLLPLVERVVSGPAAKKSDPAYWIASLYQGQADIKSIDRGVFSIYFFNIVELQPGQAIFQAAGIPHAYLQGQNVELMANSDNVLRGGLTPKHVDVPELLKHTKCEAVYPNILNGERVGDHEINYPCPVEDFAISMLQLQQGETYNTFSSSGETYLVLDGAATVNNSEVFARGECFYVLANKAINVVANSSTVIYKAYVPQHASNS